MSNLLTIHWDKLSDVIKRPDSHEECVNCGLFFKKQAQFNSKFCYQSSVFMYVFLAIQVSEPMLEEKSFFEACSRKDLEVLALVFYYLNLACSEGHILVRHMKLICW